jgi:ankyrin repeat protein
MILIKLKNSEYIQNIKCYNPEAGYPLLSYAAKEGHENIAKLLIGINNELLYIRDPFGAYPIHYAVYSGCTSLVEFMVSINPLLLIQESIYLSNALHYAATTDRSIMLRWMLLILYNLEDGDSLLLLLNDLRNDMDKTYLDIFTDIAGGDNASLFTFLLPFR